MNGKSDGNNSFAFNRSALTALVLGWIGFAGSFACIQFDFSVHNVSVVWSLIFVYLACFAYGRRGALIASWLGLSALMPLFMWVSNGWGAVVYSLIYAVIFFVHGYSAERRRHAEETETQAPWWANTFITHTGCMAFFALLHYTMVPFSMTFNPSPWAPGSGTLMTVEVLHAICIKEAITTFIFVAIAETMVSLNPVRLLLGLRVITSWKINLQLLVLSAGLGVAAWLADVSFFSLLIARIPLMDSLMRNSAQHALSFVVILFVSLVAAMAVIEYMRRSEIYLSSLRRTERDLRSAQELYRAVVEASPDGITVTDLAGEIIYISPRAQHLYGISKVENALGRRAMDFVTPEDRDRVMAGKMDLLNLQEIHHEEYRLLREDGATFIGEINGALARDATGMPTCIVAVTRDVTDRKRAEESRMELERQVLQTQKLESLGVLAGGIAHDFNNILAAIMGHADLARIELDQGSPAMESIQEVLRASHRAADLCRQMLAYSGKGSFVIEDLDLSEVIREMVHFMRTTISRKARLEMNLERELPLVRGDATQLRQIVMNLITNASEALHDSAGMITLTTCQWVVGPHNPVTSIGGAALAPGDYVLLEVSDTGCGMTEDVLGRVFEPFYTTKFTGRGLGLSAVLGIVQSHEGALTVDSVPGRGTTFRIFLPISITASLAAGRTFATDGEGLVSSNRYVGTVMIVDDEEPIRKLAKRMLERLGCTVLLASDGQEAVDLCVTRGGKLDCILLDLMMPRKDGYQVYAEIRQIYPLIPVVMASGYTEDVVGEKIPKEGLAGFVQKPYMLSDLIERLDSILPSAKSKETHS